MELNLCKLTFAYVIIWKWSVTEMIPERHACEPLTCKISSTSPPPPDSSLALTVIMHVAQQLQAWPHTSLILLRGGTGQPFLKANKPPFSAARARTMIWRRARGWSGDRMRRMNCMMGGGGERGWRSPGSSLPWGRACLQWWSSNSWAIGLNFNFATHRCNKK